MKKGKGSMIMLDILEIQKTGQHRRLSWISNKLMMLIVIICLMLHIQVTAKGFGPISKIFNMTFQRYVATL